METVSSSLQWKPLCEQTNLIYPASFYFVSETPHCGKPIYDSLLVQLNLKTKPGKEFQAINFLSNNGDEINDHLSLGLLGVEKNCGFKFDLLEVFDRWGNRVFNTKDPEFKWPTKKDELGSFFFVMKLNDSTTTGWIHVFN
jgi:hypothetical protein